MNRSRLLLAGWLIVLALSATLPLSALFRGVVHLGPETVTVKSQDRSPIISIGGAVSIPERSRTVVVSAFSDIHLLRRADDDLVSLGGRIFLAPHSSLRADALSLFGGIYKSPSSRVQGRLGGALHAWDGRSEPQGLSLGRLLKNSIRLGLAAGLALLLVCTCVAIVFPWQVVLISTTLRDSPLRSVGAAVMSLLTFLFLVVPLGLSLAGLPFAILLSGAAGLAWLFGLTAFALALGRQIARGPASLLWATAAGLVALALAMAMPLVGPLIVISAGICGAGALALALITRARPEGAIP